MEHGQYSPYAVSTEARACGIDHALVYAMLSALGCVRFLVSAGADRGAGALFVWSLLAFVTARRRPRIPRAIVVSKRGVLT
jgi:hypothetical protein